MPTKKEKVSAVKKTVKTVKTAKPTPKKEKIENQQIAENEILASEAVGENTENPTDESNKSKNGWMIAGLIFFLLASSLLLYYIFSEGIPLNGNDPYAQNNSTPVKDSGVLENMGPVTKDTEVKKGHTIKVDYVGKLEDGTVFDSSLEEFAKKAKNYDAKSGRKYEPLEFSVGAGQMIKGFDDGVIGMKVGEKKTLKISPKDAYGEGFNAQTVETKYLQDRFDQDVPSDSFKDVITRDFPKEMLGEKASTVKVGEIIDSSGISGKVTAITASGVTIEIQNTQNPFYGKKLEVGSKSSYQGNEIIIKKITDATVTVNIENKQNPFYGKKLVAGLSGKLPNGQEVRIVKVGDEKTEVEIKNSHELAGKTLIFEVELKEIVK